MSSAAAIPDAVVEYDRLVDAWQTLLAGVRPEQWSLPTPCTEWDVRALVNHVVIGNRRFAAGVLGSGAVDRGADHLGDDPAGAFAESGRALHDAFVGEGAMERMCPSPFGDVPGEMLARMRVTELMVHGWDLATATGQRLDVAEEHAERTLARLRPAFASRPREAGGMFGVEQPVDEAAPALDRLAGFLGRSV